MNISWFIKRLFLVSLLVCAGAVFSCDEAVEIEPIDDTEPLGFVSKAGFIEIEPITYFLDPEGPYYTEQEFTTSRTRIWYSLQLADEEPEEKPLFVFFNGGPGSSTGLLFSYNTSRLSLDPEHNGGKVIGDNPYSWTKMGNLLYIDARQTGFSYSLADPDDGSAEYSKRNFNPFIDGADFVRVVLRVLKQNPEIRSNRVVLVGESYGGVRACVMLSYLLYYTDYLYPNGLFRDPALVQEITEHFEAVFPRYKNTVLSPKIISRQFGHQILIQPFIAGVVQETLGAELLMQEGSPLLEMATKKGLDILECEEQPGILCNPMSLKTSIISQAAVDPYHINHPAGYTTERTSARLQLVNFDILKQMIDMDPRHIDELYAKNRKDANHGLLDTLAAVSQLDGNLWQTFGMLTMRDAYYVASSVSVYPLNLLPTSMFNPVFGMMFLENIPYVKTMITNAKWDTVCYTPAIPASFRNSVYGDFVESVDEHRVSFTINYTENAFPGQNIESERIYFPRYEESGHMVSVFEPEKLLNDAEWWCRVTDVFDEYSRYPRRRLPLSARFN